MRIIRRIKNGLKKVARKVFSRKAAVVVSAATGFIALIGAAAANLLGMLAAISGGVTASKVVLILLFGGAAGGVKYLAAIIGFMVLAVVCFAVASKLAAKDIEAEASEAAAEGDFIDVESVDATGRKVPKANKRFTPPKARTFTKDDIGPAA